jgi:hypothetical protein
MPNIEFFGICNDSEIATSAIVAIKQGLSTDDLLDTVFTYHNATVLSVNDVLAPFVRVSDTDKKRSEVIADLISNYVDVEVAFLKNFRPKK